MSTPARPLPDLVPLARFGPVIYAQIDGVFAVHDDGRLLYHSSLKEWPASPEAKAAALDAEIAASSAKLAALQAKRSGLRPTGLLPAPDDEGKKPKRSAARRVRCLACDGRLFVEGHFRTHVEKKHPGEDPRNLEYHPDLPWPRPEPAQAPAEHDAGNA